MVKWSNRSLQLGRIIYPPTSSHQHQRQLTCIVVTGKHFGKCNSRTQEDNQIYSIYSNTHRRFFHLTKEWPVPTVEYMKVGPWLWNFGLVIVNYSSEVLSNKFLGRWILSFIIALQLGNMLKI